MGSTRRTILSQNTPFSLETPTLAFSKEGQGKGPCPGDLHSHMQPVKGRPSQSASVIISPGCKKQTGSFNLGFSFSQSWRLEVQAQGVSQLLSDEGCLLCLCLVCEFGGVSHFSIFLFLSGIFFKGSHLIMETSSP